MMTAAFLAHFIQVSVGTLDILKVDTECPEDVQCHGMTVQDDGNVI